MNKEKVRVELIVKGVVQEVFYRRTVKCIAQEYDIVGEVNNKEDGTVSVTAEGNKDNIRKFIERIEIKPQFSLDEIEKKKSKGEIIQPSPLINVKELIGKDEFKPATGKFDDKGFQILYDKDPLKEMMVGISAGGYQIGTLSDVTGYDFYALGEKYDKISVSATSLNQNFLLLINSLNKNFKYLIFLAFGFGISLLLMIYYF